MYWRIGEKLSGVALLGEAEFAFPEPSYFKSLALDEAARHRSSFDAALLDLPVTTADPMAVRSARQLCERQLSELEPSEQLADRVRTLLFDRASGAINNPAVVARSLGASERTLKRKLAEQGTSYSELLERERHNRAVELLRGAASIKKLPNASATATQPISRARFGVGPAVPRAYIAPVLSVGFSCARARPQRSRAHCDQARPRPRCSSVSATKLAST